MKDGIYRVTLTIDGLPVVAEARVHNGVFQGIGELAGIVGVFRTESGVPIAGLEPGMPDQGTGEGGMWQRTAFDPNTLSPLEIDAAGLRSEVRLTALANDRDGRREAADTEVHPLPDATTTSRH